MSTKKEAKVGLEQLKCGLIAPIAAMDGCSEAHWEEVRTIIKEALQDTEFKIELVSDSNEIGIIQKRIVENIYSNEMIICDVSGKNPNVMFELGMRLAFDKPTIIIKDDKTNYSFDTGQIEHLEYPRDLHYSKIQAFKILLKTKVLATYEASRKPEYTTFLKHFGHFITKEIESKPVGADQFIIETLLEMKSEIRTLRLEQSSTNQVFTSRAVPNSVSADDIKSYVRGYLQFTKSDILKMSDHDLSTLANSLTDGFISHKDLNLQDDAKSSILKIMHRTLSQPPL